MGTVTNKYKLTTVYLARESDRILWETAKQKAYTQKISLSQFVLQSLAAVLKQPYTPEGESERVYTDTMGRPYRRKSRESTKRMAKEDASSG
jgi:hypothetical protein